MDLTVPNPTHRVTLEHDSRLLLGTKESFEQGQKQNQEIIAFAQSLKLDERFVGVEVFYESPFDADRSTTEEDYDAVLIDTEEGTVVGTLPPYDKLDPDWKSKREVTDE